MIHLSRALWVICIGLHGCGGLLPDSHTESVPPTCEQLTVMLQVQAQALTNVTSAPIVDLHNPTFLQICKRLPKDTRRCIEPRFQVTHFDLCEQQWARLPKSDRKQLKKLTNLGQTP